MRRLLCLGLVVGSALLALSVLPAVAAAIPPSFTWKGESGEQQWSQTANWEGGVAPSGEVGTLSFPRLSSPNCTASPPKATCYRSTNSTAGIKANALSIDDGSPYTITGQGITLGAGGITAKPAVECTGEEFCPPPFLGIPLTLSAAQKWSVSGTHGSQLTVSSVSGSEHALEVSLSSGSFLGFAGPAEVGELKASGEGAIGLVGGQSLNGEDGHPVKLSGGATLLAPFGAPTVGPLEVGEGGGVVVGEGFFEEGGESKVLTVNGSARLGAATNLTLYLIHAGSTAGVDYSQLNASESVHLSGAALNLIVGGEEAGGKFPCVHLAPGAVLTLVTATGAIEGTFANAPEGAEIKPLFCQGEEHGELQPVRINYSAHAVTGTVLESKEEHRRHEEEAAARKRSEEETAARKHAEEEAAARKHAEEEAAARKHAEEEAARKHAAEEAARKLLEEEQHPTVTIVKVKVTRKGLQITFDLSQPGTVTVTAPGCKKFAKSLPAGVEQVMLLFNSKGKRERAQRKRIKLSVQLNDGHAVVSGAKTLKL